MNRLQTLREWVTFFSTGLIVATLAVVFLFRNSPHTSDDIILAIAVPLIIFNCAPPFVGWGLNYISQRFITPESQRQAAPPQPLSSFPWKVRVIAIVALGVIVGTLLCVVAACSIFLASFAYGPLNLAWASAPARHLAYRLFVISALPVIALSGFVAGIYVAARVRDRATLWGWISKRVMNPPYWPTAA